MEEAKPDRATRTRNALLNAGFELLADRSVEAIPIDDLISAAGVGKGSFFNHFGDKDGFKAAIAIHIRGEIEAQISHANSDVENPLERLVGGMREVTKYALENRTRTLVLLRMNAGATTKDYPLNEGIFADIEACCAADLIRTQSVEMAVLYWLGLCVALMALVVENSLSQAEAAGKLQEMIVLGLTGLGTQEASTHTIANQSASLLKHG
ncbi:TetR/AcrR family transcriptional regulator [Erythrobacter sp. F6033]|uniref:TetR/AcrR family transcriptional regulator n=1 Tax=Erythrobacter sp. F6033 TaxID=2926401 RepID=UPI001FF4619C|nr:TetR/AcrR family transcriptional regulator [Erythrobacter sp. F6033]MCK0129246.1 TetR/AcrR family transcriptional regulator [Erythrobacter sp. F6033]